MNIETLKTDLKKFERHSHNQFGYKQYAEPIIKQVPQIIETVETIKAEVFEMNRLILHLINIEEFTKKVETRFREVIMNDPLEYIDEEGWVNLSEENGIDCAVEHVFESEVGAFDIPSILFEEVAERFNGAVLDELKDDVKEVWNDSVEYSRDTLAYYGMSQKDFL